MTAPSDIARQVMAALAERQQIAPVTDTDPAFDLAAAYREAGEVRRMREASGEQVVGRKVGFTNRTIWAEYGVYAPIWGYVYDTTLHRISDLQEPFDIGHLLEPRIEPEIVFSLSRPPEVGMDEETLLSCISWVTHGFEVVQSLFPAWRFKAADTVAAFGLHGALLVGEPQQVTPGDWASWLESLSSFAISLKRNSAAADEGQAANVLGGGPMAALRHLVEVLGRDPDSPPLRTGEIVSTGTLTRALPIAPGETWTTDLRGVPLAGISLTFSAAPGER